MAFFTPASRPIAERPAAGLTVPLRQHRWPALGTVCEVQFACAEEAEAERFIAAAVAWVTNFEAKYSRFRPDSLISRINAAAGREWVEVDTEAEQMLDLSAAVFQLSQGSLDITALPLLRLWNYQAETPRVPSDAEIAAAQKLVGWNKVQRAPGRIFLPEPGMALDLGGWGKEYAVDMVAQIGLQQGLTQLLVDFGHDIRAIGAAPGKPAWHVGLEAPDHPGATWGSLAARDRGVATSGDYLRGFTHQGRRYGHIVDVRTGRPVAHGARQVVALAPTCLQAGILATTAFIAGGEAGTNLIQQTYDAEGCLLTAKAKYQTRGFFNYVVS